MRAEFYGGKGGARSIETFTAENLKTIHGHLTVGGCPQITELAVRRQCVRGEIEYRCHSLRVVNDDPCFSKRTVLHDDAVIVCIIGWISVRHDRRRLNPLLDKLCDAGKLDINDGLSTELKTFESKPDVESNIVPLAWLQRKQSQLADLVAGCVEERLPAWIGFHFV
jgi:hypothetical protein